MDLLSLSPDDLQGIRQKCGANFPQATADAFTLRDPHPSYEASSTGRRFFLWGMSSSGPNAAALGSISALRSRTRQLSRNNPHVANAIEKWASNLVGTGIVPRWESVKSGVQKTLDRLWEDWTDESDADGVNDFYGQQYLVAHSLPESGEALVRFLPRRHEDGLSVPFQLQVLEPDHLDESFETIAPNGNQIRMGIEFDALGRRVAYHLFRNHPGEQFYTVNNVQRVRVPASEICHVYRPLRAGQLRGISWAAPVISRLYELDQYEDAELVRKKCAAMFGGFIEENLPEISMDNPLVGHPIAPDSHNQQIVKFEPGMFVGLPPGSRVNFSNPADVGANYSQWIMQQLRSIASGMGITYEQLTGDLSGVNYSSIRAGLLEFQRLCEAIQWHTLIFQFCRPVLNRWIETVALSGAVPLPGYQRNPRDYKRVKWHTPGWQWVDPESEVDAEIKAIQAGLSTKAASISRRGLIPEDIAIKRAEENKVADELGLVESTDLRKTGANAASATPQATPSRKMKESKSPEQEKKEASNAAS